MNKIYMFYFRSFKAKIKFTNRTDLAAAVHELRPQEIERIPMCKDDVILNKLVYDGVIDRMTHIEILELPCPK